MAHHRLKIVVAGGVAALALASCGGGGGDIPDQEADAMLAQLGQIEGAVEAEDCATAESGFSELQGTVGGLGRAVDREVREDLTALTVSLESELGEFCADVAEEEPEEPAVPIEPPPEETIPPPVDEVSPEDETVPPGQGGPGRGQGQGDGDDDSGGVGTEDD